MTCIVATKHSGEVHMGADSAGVAGLSILTRKDPKLFRVGSMLFGCCGSFRAMQLIRFGQWNLDPDHLPHPEPRDPFEAMVTLLIPRWRQVLMDGGYLRKTENEEHMSSSFLVGWRGEIFEIEGDLQVGMSQHEFAAVGCGRDLALGSMHAVAQSRGPRDTLHAALSAAEEFSAGVRRPFIFASTGNSSPPAP